MSNINYKILKWDLDLGWFIQTIVLKGTRGTKGRSLSVRCNTRRASEWSETWLNMHINFIKYDLKSNPFNKKNLKFIYLKENSMKK